MRAFSPPPPATAELCLRFACSGCRDLLFIPVEQLVSSKSEHCPKCKSAIEFPSIDERVKGYSQVVASAVNDCRNVPCPKCAKTLRVPREWPGAVRKCPGCKSQFQMQIVATPAKPAQAKAASPDAKAADAGGTKSANGALRPSPSKASNSPPPTRQAQAPDEKPKPAHKAAPSTPAKVSIEFDCESSRSTEKKSELRAHPAPAEKIATLDEPEPNGPEPVVYRGQQASSSSPLGFVIFDVSAHPRLTWWALYWSFLVGPPLLSCGSFIVSAGIIQDTGLSAISLICCVLSWVWLSFGWYVSRILTNLVASALICSFRCPGCGEQHEAKSVWNCGCGYKDHRERHALTFRCPKCRSYLGYTDCIRCGATMIIR